jgi:secreted trypsin-like serine protease
MLGGNNAGKGAYPFHAAIIYKNLQTMTMENFTRPFCGGAIISKNFVLSAAHCFMGTDGATISETDIQVCICNTVW